MALNLNVKFLEEPFMWKPHTQRESETCVMFENFFKTKT